MRKWKQLYPMLDAVSDEVTVYYQPPEEIKLDYPAILFEKTGGEYSFANNKVNSKAAKFKVTVIYKDPNFEYEESMSHIRYCSPDTSFRTEGLYHDVYTVYV